MSLPHIDIASLPPKPDRESGEPRPPHAPVLSNSPRQDRQRKARGRRAAPPPPGKGPALEWSRPERFDIIAPAAIIAALGALYATFKFGGLGWMLYWQVWIAILIAFLWFLYTAKKDYIAAGSDWFMFRKNWVDTYQLTRVNAVKASFGFDIQLTDATNDTTLSVGLRIIQHEPRLWDLVYNGILHSIASGAAKEVNSLAREQLKLPG